MNQSCKTIPFEKPFQPVNFYRYILSASCFFFYVKDLKPLDRKVLLFHTFVEMRMRFIEGYDFFVKSFPSPVCFQTTKCITLSVISCLWPNWIVIGIQVFSQNILSCATMSNWKLKNSPRWLVLTAVIFSTDWPLPDHTGLF